MHDLPDSLSSDRARARLACLDPDYAARLVAVRRRMDEAQTRVVDVALSLGRSTKSEKVYLRSVLAAMTVSSPLLSEVETLVEVASGGLLAA